MTTTQVNSYEEFHDVVYRSDAVACNSITMHFNSNKDAGCGYIGCGVCKNIGGSVDNNIWIGSRSHVVFANANIFIRALFWR